MAKRALDAPVPKLALDPRRVLQGALRKITPGLASLPLWLMADGARDVASAKDRTRRAAELAANPSTEAMIAANKWAAALSEARTHLANARRKMASKLGISPQDATAVLLLAIVNLDEGESPAGDLLFKLDEQGVSRAVLSKTAHISREDLRKKISKARRSRAQ